MCRNIKQLFNFDPPATEDEIKEASLQFVRKVSGFNRPSKINERAFEKSVKQVSYIVRDLLGTLETNTKPKNREEEREKLKKRSIERFPN